MNRTKALSVARRLWQKSRKRKKPLLRQKQQVLEPQRIKHRNRVSKTIIRTTNQAQIARRKDRFGDSLFAMRQLELLSPAKNLQVGIAAINHGADAVYIGAPAFGARAEHQFLFQLALLYFLKMQ